MKLKIAILSSVALCCILLALGNFIYLTLYNRLISLDKNADYNEAQSISQYYASHTPDSGQPNQDVRQWLRRYDLPGKKVVIYGTNRQVLISVGELRVKALPPLSRLDNTPKQKLISLNDASTGIYTLNPIQSDEAPNRVIGYVAYISDISNVHEFMESLLMVLVPGAFGAVLLAGVGGYVIASTGLRPIHRLIQVVEGIEANRLHQRVPTPKSHDEVRRLTVTFNHMLSRIERSFEQQSRFVTDASHEIRTPLTTILGYANLLERWGKSDPDVLNKAIRVIQKEAVRLRKLADDLLLLAGLEANKSELTGESMVDEIVEDVVEGLSILYPGISIKLDLQAAVHVAIAADHLRQIITNVVSNALKYTPAGGVVAVRTRAKDYGAQIQISDSGCGIPEEDLPHIFERFYRVDKSRERTQGGNGLGLAIVKELVEAYHGHIHVDSQVNEGTTVTIELPYKT